MQKPVPQRAQRSDKGRITLTPRDLAVLPWIGEQYAARLDQVAQLLGRVAERPTQKEGIVQITTAQRVLRRWQALGVVQSRYIIAREPPWIYLSGKGLHELGLPFRFYTPTAALTAHRYWTNHVRLWVERHYPSDRWISERVLSKARENTADAAQHLVDAEIHRSDAEGEPIVIAVEVELTVKEAGRSESIMRELAERYDGIWYFTTAATHDAVERTIERLGEEVKARFRIRNLSTLA
jgi:hypothetical protein